MVLRVLHLVGSAVDELHCNLSRLYAQDCLRANADPSRYQFIIAYVTPDARWRFPFDLSSQAIATATAMSTAEAVQHVTALEIDVMVPQMFCLPGMTTYRSLFDVLGIPFVGNAPDVMAIGAHKQRARAVVAMAGVKVPPGEVLGRRDRPTLVPPVVVKPVDADNSLGITLVSDPSDYGNALAAAFAQSNEALVETYVPLGREVRCGIIVRDDRLVCLPLEEYAVNSSTKPIRTYADKIMATSDRDLALVAKNPTQAWIVDIDDPLTRRVWAAAEKCHTALGCRDYSLFDFRVDPEGEPWFLEAGLYCSFARQSVVSMMARAAGISIEDLFAEAVRGSMKRMA